MSRKQKFPHLLGSKWTSSEPQFGWRHFQVVNRSEQGPHLFAEMVSPCDPTVRFWLNARLLKNPTLWKSGWMSLQEQLVHH